MTAEETSETAVPSQDTQVTIALIVPLLSREPKSAHLMTARQMAASGPRPESADSLWQVSPGY